MTDEEILTGLQDKVRITNFGPLGRMARLGCLISISATAEGAKLTTCDTDLSKHCLDRAMVILTSGDEFVIDAGGNKHLTEFAKYDLHQVAIGK